MHVTGLSCVSCGRDYRADEIRYHCDACGSSLDVQYDYDEIADVITWERLRTRAFSHQRYERFLPAIADEDIVDMGAGGTPLIPSDNLGPALGLDNLYFKLESLNPTGSFKDRGTVVELGKALAFHRGEIVVASTGNMGASIAAYAARAGVDARIYVPQTLKGAKLKQMRSHGADIVEVAGDYTVAAERAWEDWEDEDTYLMGDYPYRGEGEKTVGHEIGDQIDADTVVLPVGNGTLMHGAWKGLWELERVGLAGSTPRMVGVQAAGCNTVVDALQKGFDRIKPVERPDTVAGAIACGDPLDGEQAMHAIEDSGGFGAAVTDEEIMDAKRRLAAEEGIYAEEAGAAAFAGIVKARDRFDRDEVVVCAVTGHGLKT